MAGYSKNADYGFGSDTNAELWTKEAKRIEQITKVEDKINAYKELGEWSLVLNSMEDYLGFQVEAIEEKVKDEGTGKVKTLKGIETNIYKEQNAEIQELIMKWEQMSLRAGDPARRMNQYQERAELIGRVKKMIGILYQNNIRFNLTYRKKNDPYEAWKE